MPSKNSQNDLALIIRSQIPLVVIESHEEQEVLAIIRRISKRTQQPAFSWTVTEGLVHQDGQGYMLEVAEPKLTAPEELLKKIKAQRTAGIYVLIDFHPYLKDAPHVVRLIKEIALGYDYIGHTLILLSHQIELPTELQPFSATFAMPIPPKKEIAQIVIEECRKWQNGPAHKVKISRKALDRLVNNLMGLTASDCKRLARKAICDDGAISEADLPAVMKAKYQLLNMDGLLSFEYDTAHFSDVGGLSHLKAWLDTRKAAFQQSPEQCRLDPPKGIMLLGVQGGGKSLAAKAVAGAWGLPLLRLDFAVLYNKYFGETERNLRKSLKMAEVMAPCVLWIDEIEKGIAAGDYDSGTSKRVLGTFLTWMAERKEQVFIVATANDISNLPPELIRKGRLDEIFFVDLPDGPTRQAIFGIHFSKREMGPQNFDLPHLAAATEGFTGAEIEQAIVSTLYRVNAQGMKITTELIIEEIRKTSPLSVVMAEKLAELREWAAVRCVRAN